LQKLSQEEFSKLAVDGAEVDDLLIGEVGVKDFGDNENEDIAERFGAKKEDFPGF
jgi:endoplasmic reticulum protein 29